MAQFLQYLPYGEIWRNQQRMGYDERFKYTGKERDEETGYEAPKGITRLDKGNPKNNEQPHVHFKDGSALNKDGTWKHGKGKLSNEQKQYLKQNGWNIE